MDDRVGKPDSPQTLAMLSAFASVGARSFDVTSLDIESREQGFQANQSIEDLQRNMARRLEAAARSQHNIVIRPRSTMALLL